VEYLEAGINTQGYLTFRTQVNSLYSNTRFRPNNTSSLGLLLLNRRWDSAMEMSFKEISVWRTE
jgi:hypothetical protein